MFLGNFNDGPVTCQVTVDLLILGQVWLYRLNTDKRRRSELTR